MIWFNIKELEKLLTQGKISDKLAFNYLLTSLIFLTVANYPSDDDPLWALYVHLIISLVVTVWGVRKTFEINQEGGNGDYFKRFISLSFVAGIRTVVFALFVSFLIVFSTLILKFAGVSFDLSLLQQELLELSGFLIFIGLYYNMLLTSFKRINSGDDSRIQVEAI